MEQTENKNMRLSLWFSVAGDLRFLSHRDTLRMWERALARTDIPVSYSQGFNPHIRMSLPLPRSVGVAAKNELFLIRLKRYCDTHMIKNQLKKQLPSGIELRDCGYIPLKVPVTPHQARYQINLTDLVDCSELLRLIDMFLLSSTWPVIRSAHGRHPERNLDLRSTIKHLKLKDHYLDCTIKINPKGTARIDEILRMLEIDTPNMVRWINRIDVGYPPELDLPFAERNLS